MWSYVTATRTPSCRQYCRLVKAGGQAPSKKLDSETIRPAEVSQNRIRPGEQGPSHTSTPCGSQGRSSTIITLFSCCCKVRVLLVSMLAWHNHQTLNRLYTHAHHVTTGKVAYQLLDLPQRWGKFFSESHWLAPTHALPCHDHHCV